MPRPPSASPSYRRHCLGRKLIAVILLLGCGGSEEPEPPPEEAFTPPTLEAAWDEEVEEIAEALGTMEELSIEQAGTEPGVEGARHAASLARVLSIRDPAGGWIARARELLAGASRDADVPGACGAALDLVALEARDAGDPSGAYRVALRTSLRFAATHAECAEEAEEVLAPLAPWTPPAEVLAAIRADPETISDEAESPADLLAGWATAQAHGRGTLESLAVYGSDAEATDTRPVAVRVVLRFDHVVAYEHGEAAAMDTAPRRTWLHLPSVAPAASVASTIEVGRGGLTSLGVRADGAGTRVTFDVEAEARFRVFVLPGPFRIVLDVETGGAHAEDEIRRIVLDPGHGGDDFGARAFGLRESDLVLDITKRVRVLLLRLLPEAQVLLTREDDTFISLEQRSAIANAVDADLFLSIHLNAADEVVDRGGVTTFVLDTTGDRQAVRLAARENGTSVADVDSLTRLLASLHREDQVAASRSFAEQLQRATLESGRSRIPRLHDRGVKSALFHVLVGARMPAVLLEASFLSREEEAMQLRTVAYRQTLAQGIAEGIVRWAR